MRPDDAKMSGKTKLIVILSLIGFACMEFPGVFFFKDMSEPYIFGFPFIYGWNLLGWIYMTIVMAIGFFMNWGEPKAPEQDKTVPAAKEGGDEK